MVLFLSGALSGCASAPPSRCDTAQVAGTCAVTVQRSGSRLVVCPVEESATTAVCMNAALDVQRSGRKEQVQVMLKPKQCQPLSTEVTSASPGNCQAFAMSRPAAAATAMSKPAAE